MWLENCLTAKPVIDFDPASGKYRVLGSEEIPDGVPLVDISEKLYGDYLDERDDAHLKLGGTIRKDAKQFFVYWNAERTRFFFQDSAGSKIEIDGRRSVAIDQAADVAGDPIAGHMQFSIYEADGQLSYRHIYDQTPYMAAYMMDFSFPEAELADWDFFVALKGSFDYMRENAHRHHGAASLDDSSILRVAAGKPASQGGWWFTPAKQSSRRFFQQGDVFPEIEGSTYGATFWQWSSDQSDPKL